MNLIAYFWHNLGAPLGCFTGASRAQNDAPLLKSPIVYAPVERCLGSSASQAHIPKTIGDSASAMAESKSPSHELQSGMVFCDWCGSLTRLVSVHGHEQCGACHHVLNECCTGEMCDGVPI